MGTDKGAGAGGLNHTGQYMRVFISYSRSDQALAHLLGYILTTAGIKCYVDRASCAGRYFDHEIKEMIRKADVVLVLSTKSSMNSAWVNQEIGFAIAHDKKVWPLALEEDLEPTGMISMTESYCTARLVKSLGGDRELAPRAVATAAPGTVTCRELVSIRYSPAVLRGANSSPSVSASWPATRTAN